jgi:5'/3'-nucleotidase SurE
LKQAGYRVSMVAPSTEQSATSMGVTSRRHLALEQFEESGWHLDGQPADTILVALRHLLENNPPDLVISGINFGPNLGQGLHMSGTIGAAIMAAHMGVPAIAISAGMQFSEIDHSPLRFPSTYEVFEPAAKFACTVVESLNNSTAHKEPLLPSNMLLNINYPALPIDKIKGVLHPQISGGKIIGLDFDLCNETGNMIPRFYPGADPSQPHLEDGDVRAHLEGYITISAVRPSWNPPASQAEALRKRLEGLTASN